MSNIQLVLLKDVTNLGKAGEIVQVKPGYARNYLLPKNLAAFLNSPEAKKILSGIKERKEEKAHQVEAKKERKIKQAEERQAMKERKTKLLAKK